MKQIVLTLITVGILCSCSKNEDKNSETDLIGSWKLIEVLADPGDGSGTFQPVESEKIIEFTNNETVTTNSSLCEPYSEEIITSGSFSLSDNTISTNCQNPNIATLFFELEDEYLILNFISNEGYSQKFQKIN
ncbi:lipocalin family protein [Psychroserpens algicola]|uniref:lipocalin family protein n=1 Tax=Psychroserpens algicola TaxID=1719034 RepID=UPI001952E674|nr:lipocalin family protein [Psychroserpens algicola]